MSERLRVDPLLPADFPPRAPHLPIEGRPLPVPGGVPLRWLAYATATLLVVVALGSGSAAVALGRSPRSPGLGARALGAGSAGRWPRSARWRRRGSAAGRSGLLDWPLRLVVIPVAVATLATQATPDGRRADRFALSWLAVHLAPLRRSLGRALPALGRRAPARRRAVGRARRALAATAPGAGPRPRRRLLLGAGLACAARGGERRRRVAQAPGRRQRRGDVSTRRLALGDGQVLEVRP